jgi:hypothetical protein
MKDIAVIIQSRDRVEMLKEVIDMLYNTCSSTDNFDIILVIDDDQIEQYSLLKELYVDTIWLYSKHQLNSWANLKQIQNNFIKESNYYFVWAICDDICGLKHGWDVAIKEKKHYFKDDLFTMYQSNDGRNINNIYESMLCSPDYTLTSDEDIAKNVWMYCEMLPISTKKWIDFMTPIYENGEYGTQHELLTGLIVGLLKKNYNIERLIKCDLWWDHLSVSGRSNDIIDTKDGLKRKDSFDLLQKKQFKKILPIVEKIYKEIKK